MNFDLETIVAFWGGFLATILASIRVWEFWQNRSQVEVSYDLRSLPELGNDLIIRNISNQRILITWWELRWEKKKFLKRFTTNIKHPEGSCDIGIEPHHSANITFKDSEHFDWSVSALNGRKLVLYLQLAGKKKMVRKLFYTNP